MQRHNNLKNNDIIYGRHPVLDAFEAGRTMDKVLLQEGTRGELEKTVRQLCRLHKVPMQVVPREKLSKICGTPNHQGIAALVALAPYYQLEDILPGVFERGGVPLFVLLDGITDVRNFGAIARSAEVFGADALVVSSKSAAPINSEAMKASAGALSRIPVCRAGSLITAIQYLRESGIRIMASDLQAGQQVYEADLTVPLALVLGSEGEGVQPAVLRAVDERFIIPQQGQTDSLNVSVAAGIMLYETRRQRLLT